MTEHKFPLLENHQEFDLAYQTHCLAIFGETSQGGIIR
jgi:hypothetical protein